MYKTGLPILRWKRDWEAYFYDYQDEDVSIVPNFTSKVSLLAVERKQTVVECSGMTSSSCE